MNHPDINEHDHQEFPGFEKSRLLMACYEARIRVRRRITETDFLADPTILAVHVDNISRADRVHLIAFDQQGREVAVDTLFIDAPGAHLDMTPEFDHELTSMAVPEGSSLAAEIAAEHGWVVNMALLRDYDLAADRRATQRAVMLAHLGDMLASGDARGFLLEKFDPGDEHDGPETH